MTNRIAPFTLILVLFLGGCGTGEMSMTEYGERIDAIAGRASQRGAELTAESTGVTDVTPRQLQSGLERGLQEIRIPLQEAADEIDPPAAIAELHDLMWDWHRGFLNVEQSLADRVATTEDTAEGWTALSDSPEMAAYRAAVAEGKQICTDFQARLDASELGGAFADTPWMPADMLEVVEAVLGCQWFPDDPSTVYLYPPADTGS